MVCCEMNVFINKLFYLVIAYSATLVEPEWDDHVSSSKAKTLIFSICNCEFIVTLFTVTSILSITSAASKLLQSVTQDVASATNCINDIIKTLNDKRTNCDVQFKKVFEESKNVMTELDVEIKQPRIVKKQNQRCNTPANSIEEYYRRILFIPIIDNVLEDIRYRFLNDKNKTISLLMQLIPSNTIKMSSETSNELIQTVGDQYAFLNFNTFMFRGELELWKTKWTTQKNEGLNIPNEVFSAFDECSNIFFPSIRKLLLVLGTLPVSVATAERSFSTLRRLKTWIRSEMGQSRLTGLALLHIHRQLPLNVDKIIDRFAKDKRCLDFVI
ncbi:52 kDa repressor of the inhibitor of the protein kinase-like [Acyrthosiphon pisum]|uniref:HAT C-terminal dimerisation domain-containing protein n=1 Tax=Acyrthosiphon pisum TaxID=7029 RepID=A0A8R1X182_ACYPI|nr:52 kDa repressor of the inhibitor of the protein kinase-like [Acyrthosiphon pisum]|eukprot:XP_008179706.1 PREDICTED: 52 kDa repressor of the inhibitor of the protein kinase-like [Acyrthosiphon pisum]